MDQEKSKYNAPTITKWHLNIKPLSWCPPHDVFEDDESYLIRVEIAGMKQENFLIWLEDGMLIITGERPPADIPNNTHREIIYGKFQVSVDVPIKIAKSEVEANYQNGFLNVYLPKLS